MNNLVRGIFGGGAAAFKPIGNFLFGSPPETKQLPTMNKGQQALLSQLLQLLNPQGQIGQGNQEAIDLQRQYLDPSSEAVNQFAQPYMDQFNQQTVPGLAERFAGLGAMGGGLSSSGFGQSLSAAGGNLQNQLAALKAGLGQQAAQSLMGQYGGLTGQALGQRPFGYVQQPGTQGFAPQALSSYFKGGFPGLGG
jgi:hypothetical protein